MDSKDLENNKDSRQAADRPRLTYRGAWIIPLPGCDEWGTPLAKMPDCPRCEDDELGMLQPGFAVCYACQLEIIGDDTALAETVKAKIARIAEDHIRNSTV